MAALLLVALWALMGVAGVLAFRSPTVPARGAWQHHQQSSRQRPNGDGRGPSVRCYAEQPPPPPRPSFLSNLFGGGNKQQQQQQQQQQKQPRPGAGGGGGKPPLTPQKPASPRPAPFVWPRSPSAAGDGRKEAAGAAAAGGKGRPQVGGRGKQQQQQQQQPQPPRKGARALAPGLKVEEKANGGGGGGGGGGDDDGSPLARVRAAVGGLSAALQTPVAVGPILSECCWVYGGAHIYGWGG
jgi:hypothetical protein